MTLLTLLGLYVAVFLIAFVLAGYRIAQLRRSDPFGDYVIYWPQLALYPAVLVSVIAGVVWAVQQLVRMIA